jgi:hypothetical protein
MADLRWVQAQAVRSAVDRNEGGLSGPEAGRTGTSEPRPAGDERGNAAAGDLLPVEGGGRAAHWRELSPVTTGAYVPLAQMLELCRGWMGAP